MATPRVCSEELTFTSQVTPTEPPSGHSIELMKQEIEMYLERLREAICEDLQDVFARLDAIEGVLVGCCGTTLGGS